MTRSYDFFSDTLVQRVNELYHDLIKEKYQYSHPEIFLHETARWRRIFSKFPRAINPITILDIGTGTGFVPLIIAKFFKKSDTFICCDISKGVLDVAKKNIEKNNFQCDFKFVKIEKSLPLKLPFESISIDLITINSVLHHIKDTNFFLNELHRILKKKGLIFLGHEPNKYFYKNTFLKINHFILENFYPPVRILYKISTILRKILYLNFSKKVIHPSIYTSITNKINNTLIKEKLIPHCLSFDDIAKIVDIKSREGFKPDLLFSQYKLLHLETYNHLGKRSLGYYDKLIIRKYDNLLKRLFPQAGATFFLVVKKKIDS